MHWEQMLSDNPILVKHVRSRLRLGQVVPWVAMVVVLCVCNAWAGSLPWFGGEVSVTLLIGLQILILAFGGSNQITSSLGGARESGILDFHRVSPLPSAVIALGFFLGAPIREYLLFVITLPFALYGATLIDASDPWGGVSRVAQIEVALVTTAWIVHAIAMLGSLVRKKPRGSIQGTVATVFLMLILLYLGSFGVYFGTQWLLREHLRANLFGVLIPWLPWLLIYEMPVLGFLGLAVVRKMRAERTHPYTKAEALACMAALTVLATGGLWGLARFVVDLSPYDPTPTDMILIATVYVLTFAAMILGLTIAPDANEYIKGVRRACREGGRRPSPWSDAGSNRVALFALCAMVPLGAWAVVQVIGRPARRDGQEYVRNWGYNPAVIDPTTMSDAEWVATRQSLISRPVVIGVMTSAYVGLGFQFFSFRAPRSRLVLMSFFLFLAWLVPLVAGAIVGMGASGNEEKAWPILSLSPLFGIAISSGVGRAGAADAIQLAALAPPITFAFFLNYLLVVAQRRIDRALLAAEKKRAAPSPVGEE